MPTNAQSIVDRVRGTLQRHAMLAEGDVVLAAVSGGPDSMALLDILLELGYPVQVAHLDHETRDGDSAKDAAFVQAEAERRSLPFHGASLQTIPAAVLASGSFEQIAREVRYEFLNRIANESNCDAVATGHHADDVAETMLMRLLRGTSPEGLCGIPPVRPLGIHKVIRPLIDCTRNEILAYLNERGIQYRTDASNTDTQYLRNRVRHELIPFLTKEYNPQLRNALVRLSDIQRDEDALLDTLIDEFVESCDCSEHALALDRATFAAGEPALQRRALRAFAHGLRVDCPFERIEEARAFVASGKTGAAFDLGGGITLRNTRSTTELDISNRVVKPEKQPLNVPGETDFLGKRFAVRRLDIVPDIPLPEYCGPTRQVFDAQKLGDALTVRTRNPGDRFTPFGMSGSKKLQDYFVDIGLPQRARDTTPIVVAGDAIAWVVGHAVSAHVAVTADTQSFVEIEVHDAAE